MNSTSKFNVGDKVRILDVDAIIWGSEHWKNGDVVDIVNFTSNGNPCLRKRRGDDVGLVVTPDEFHAIERISPLSKKRRIEALEKDVARQETELEELRAKIEAFEQKAKLVEWGMQKATSSYDNPSAADIIASLHGGEIVEVDGQPMFVKTSLTPNQRRARIIADAKGFVEQTIEAARDEDEDGDIVVPDPSEIENPWFCSEIKFEINAEKRTVVALAIGFCDDKVCEKAIAKCAPADVFNADIGKAIAVGRLFGLDVERFVNAPKPDKFVVGHVVQIARLGDLEQIYGVGKITDVNDSSRRYYYDSTTFKSDTYRPTFMGPIGTPDGPKILDDTEAQYV